jgi:hypothetical protein
MAIDTHRDVNRFDMRHWWVSHPRVLVIAQSASVTTTPKSLAIPQIPPPESSTHSLPQLDLTAAKNA